MTNPKLHRDLPSLSSELRELVREDGSLPPVESWQPEREGEIDIAIDLHGKWFYQGDAMDRMSVVRMLSSILRKDGDEYFLVTPVEKMKISVADVPFVIPMMDREGSGGSQKIHLTTQMGDCFTLSGSHPLEFLKNDQGDDVPYVLVRGGLKARLNRSVYYELADIVEESENHPGHWGVWSDGDFFEFVSE